MGRHAKPGAGEPSSGERAEAPISFAELTTMRVGGVADRVVVARTKVELAQHALELSASGEPWLLLGGGSNTVMCDEGFRGTVLLVRNEGADRVGEDHGDGRVRLRVQAGQDWDALVDFCVSSGWAGIEALSGIPGLAGAAPVQNIGAYGAELSDVLHSIECFDEQTGQIVRLSSEELELGYRNSALKRGRRGVVLSIDLVLQTNSAEQSSPIAYRQLADALGVSLGDRVPLARLREAVLELRRSKGMVLDENDHDTWSAGSFFTNPIVSEKFARSLPPEAPRFELEPDADDVTILTFDDLERGAVPPISRQDPAERAVKLSAAWLIEQSGIARGFHLPGSGAAISSKHTLAITNRGAASAADVAELARLVVQRVQQEFGVLLAPEPNLYGLEVR